MLKTKQEIESSRIAFEKELGMGKKLVSALPHAFRVHPNLTVLRCQQEKLAKVAL